MKAIFLRFLFIVVFASEDRLSIGICAKEDTKERLLSASAFLLRPSYTTLVETS